MADNDDLQSVAPSTLPAGLKIGFRRVTYSGDPNAAVAPSGMLAFAGADDAKIAFDLGACLTNHKVSAGSTNATSAKATPGLLVGVRVFNLAAYPIYVKFHNVAGAPTPGVGVVYTVGVQSGVCRDVLIPGGRYFDTGIAYSIVKGIADADATAVLASDCVVDVEYN